MSISHTFLVSSQKEYFQKINWFFRRTKFYSKFKVKIKKADEDIIQEIKSPWITPSSLPSHHARTSQPNSKPSKPESSKP